MESINTILADELEQLRQRIVANMERVGAVASGRTRDSMHVEVVADTQGILYGGLPDGAPFGTLETGSAPHGHARYSYPKQPLPRSFAAIIYDWMVAKGITAQPTGSQTQEQANRSLSYAIAITIARSGTKLFRNGGRTDIYSNEIPQTIANVNARVIKELQLQVEDINQNLAEHLIT